MLGIFKGPQTYVIKSWEASAEPDENGIYVNIKGRKGGLIAFILSFMGIDPIVSLVVDRENIRFKEASLSGFNARVTSISNLCSGKFGYSKPFRTSIILFTIGLAILTTDMSGAQYFFGPVIMLYGLYKYFFGKATTLGVTYQDSQEDIFAFKRSIIEGQNIDEVAAERIIAIVEMIMLGKDNPRVVEENQNPPTNSDFAEKAQKRMNEMKEKAKEATNQVAASVAEKTASSDKKPCPKCGNTLAIDDKFCGVCGEKVGN